MENQNNNQNGQDAMRAQQIINEVVHLLFLMGCIPADIAQLAAVWYCMFPQGTGDTEMYAFFQAFINVVHMLQGYDATGATSANTFYPDFYDDGLLCRAQGDNSVSIGERYLPRVCMDLIHRRTGNLEVCPYTLIQMIEMIKNLFQRVDLPLTYIIHMSPDDLMKLCDFLMMVPVDREGELPEDDNEDNNEDDANDGNHGNGDNPQGGIRRGRGRVVLGRLA